MGWRMRLCVMYQFAGKHENPIHELIQSCFVRYRNEDHMGIVVHKMEMIKSERVRVQIDLFWQAIAVAELKPRN